MSAAALLILGFLGATPVTDTLAPYRGQPVLAIEIEAPPGEDLEFLRSLIDIQPGYLFAVGQVEEAIKRIYALGRFTNVEVSAQRLSGVVLLFFRLRPIQRLDRLEIEGINWADEEALRAALKLRAGAEVDRRTPELLRARATEHLAAVGFPNARVTVESLEAAPNAVERSYRMHLIEALPRLIAAIRFIGAPRAHPSVLEAIMSTRAGDLLDLTKLARDREAMEKAYRARGFLRARVDEARVQSVGDVHTVLFNIDAGDRIDLELAGNRAVTEEDLRALLPEQIGPLSDDMLTVYADAIAEHYRRRGYADAKVEIRGYRDPERGITRYLFRIDEGRPVRVTRLAFEGASAIPAATLEEQVRSVLRDELRVDADFMQVGNGELETAAFGRPPYGARPAGPPLETTLPPEERWVPELYDKALDGIRAVYRDRGFVAVEVGAPELVRDGDTVAVRVRVAEGPQTVIDSVSFVGNQALAAADLLVELEVSSASTEGATAITPGGAFSASAIENGRIALVRRYRDLGFLYANVFSEAVPAEGSIDEEVAYAAVTFVVEEGPQVRIRNVLVRGNRHTDTDTIKSQISLQRGDLYRLEQAVRDQRAISRLEVFESVQVKLIDEERPAEEKDLVAEVVERKRHAFEPSFGLSTADGVRAGLAYSHNNLFGYAAMLTLEARFNRELFFELYGDYRQTMEDRYAHYTAIEQLTKGIERTLHAGVRSRRFALGPVGTALRLDFLNEQDNTVAYSTHRTALLGGFELYPTERISLTVEPEVAITDAQCPGSTQVGWCLTGTGAANDQLPEGVRVAFKIGPTVTFDFRDDQFRPTSGVWLKANATYGIGELWPRLSAGSASRSEPFSIAKVEATVIGYLPIFGPVLVLTARAGHIFEITGEAPVDERFYIGGRETLRGFVEKSLLPADSCIAAATGQRRGCAETITTDPPVTRGGKTYLLLRNELRFDITESFSIDVFCDIGNLWLRIDRAARFDVRIGIGAGLRYNTPVGAVVLEFGFNPDPGRYLVSVPSDVGPPTLGVHSYEPIFEPHFSVSRF